jgi:hypothetical protein
VTEKLGGTPNGGAEQLGAREIAAASGGAVPAELEVGDKVRDLVVITEKFRGASEN